MPSILGRFVLSACASGALALFAGTASAQTYHRAITSTEDEGFDDILPTPDGGFVCVGSQLPEMIFDVKWFVSKHTAAGTVQWTTTLNGGGGYDLAASVELTDDGGYIVAGKADPGLFQPGVLTVARLSSTGSLVWARQYPAGSFGCIDCTDAPTIRRISFGSGERPRGITIPEYAIVHYTGVDVGQNSVSVGELLLIDGGGNIVTHTLFQSPFAASDEGVAFQDVAFFDDPEPSLGIIGSYGGLSLPSEQYSTDILFVNYSLVSGSVVAAWRYNEVDPSDPQQPIYEFGRGISVKDAGSGPRFLLAARADRLFGFNNTIALDVNALGIPSWMIGCRDIEPEVGSARWDAGGNAVIAGNYFFGDGGRMARMLSLDPAGAPRFFREYAPTFNQGFYGLHIMNDGTQDFYHPVGEFPTLGFGSSDAYFVRTDSNGAVGCSDDAIDPDIDAPNLMLIATSFVTTQLFDSNPWLPVVVQGAPTIRDLCTPQTCVADVDDGSGTGTPDGSVDIADLLYYLGLFDAGDLAADLDDGSGTGTPDGSVDISDLLYYLARFDAGC